MPTGKEADCGLTTLYVVVDRQGPLDSPGQSGRMISCKKCRDANLLHCKADNEGCPLFYCGKRGDNVAGPIYLHVDITELQGKIEQMRAIHTQREFELLMMRAFRRTGGAVRRIMKEQLPKEYEAKPRWITSNVGNPRTQFGGFGGMAVSCNIPIDGARGVLGRRFSASGPRGRRAKGKRYKISAKIVKSGVSVLPSVMKNYGDGEQPPFIAKGGGVGGMVFVRKGKKRLPIARVVGLGVPQMPMNRSEDDVQDEIMEVLKGRIEQEHRFLVGKIK